MPSVQARMSNKIQARNTEGERSEALSPPRSSSITANPREIGTTNVYQAGTESSSLNKVESSAPATKDKHKLSSESTLKETDGMSREDGQANERFLCQANATESERPSSRQKTSHDIINELRVEQKKGHDDTNSELKQVNKQSSSSTTTSVEKNVMVQEGEAKGENKPVKQHDIFREIRMERKRKREMQRRSNVNRELDHLAELITNINPPELRNSLSNKYVDDNNHAPLNRLELIHVAVKTLERLHFQSEKDASRIYELTMELNSLKEMNNYDKVTMMLPVMVPTNERVNTGDPIPNGSIFLPPRIPNNLLKRQPAPTLYNVPPFPENSMFSQIPNGMNMRKQLLPTSNPLSGLNNSEPHYVLLPDHCAPSDLPLRNNQFLNMNSEELKALLASKIASQIGHRPV